MTVTDTWTLGEFFAAHDVGTFDGRRVELIGGKVCGVASEGWENRMAIGKLSSALTGHLIEHGLNDEWLVDNRAGVISMDSYIEPDISIVPATLRRNPTIADCAVIIEVADSSAKRDEGTKRDLARNQGAKLYYVVDLAGPTLTFWGQTTQSLSVPKLEIEISLDDLWQICGLDS